MSPILQLSALNALSPLDGRYQTKLDSLRPYFSEYALIKHRAWVEVEWLKALSAAQQLQEIAPFSAETIKELDAAIAQFSEADAAQVKAIEARTNHDVKALEYWLKEKFDANSEVKKASEFIHFACTSEDINNLSHGLMLKGARDIVMLPFLATLIARLTELASQLADTPMLSRTNCSLNRTGYTTCGYTYAQPHTWANCLADHCGQRVCERGISFEAPREAT